MDTPQDVIRRYWRDKKRAQRASDKVAAFTPRITRFERCSFCRQWHPTEAILSNGTMPRFTLDSFHKKESILTFVRGLEAGLPKTAAFIDLEHATALCMKQLMDETGISEDAALKQAETLIRNDGYRDKLIKLHHDTAVLESVRNRNLKMCMISRMELYKENEDIARANCMNILEDPLYRHFPPGLVKDPQGRYDLTGPVLVPLEIDSTPELTRNPALMALGQCFTEKMREKPSADPQKIVEECMGKVRSTEHGEPEKPAVGDLFGKSPAEIRAMTRTKPDQALTVGDIYGKTRKQLLRMQRHGWDQEENEAFEQCVLRKMKEGKTRDEAEKICEALSATSADRAGAKKKLPMAGGVWGSTHI
ncbi:hypothetical protein KAU55_00720 [Candidatus Bathyarchaeota archaeon]|nr:hypothetical protein [Candidatus Bathyarchaeota archaeon]